MERVEVTATNAIFGFTFGSNRRFSPAPVSQELHNSCQGSDSLLPFHFLRPLCVILNAGWQCIATDIIDIAPGTPPTSRMWQVFGTQWGGRAAAKNSIAQYVPTNTNSPTTTSHAMRNILLTALI
jgi:hypothetical protein